VRNGKSVGVPEGCASGIVVDEATRWLRDGRDQTKPFFLYVGFHEPHEPIAAADEFKKLYPSDDTSLRAHHGNISQMDAAFGRLMRVLDDEKVRDTTFVMFTSDNGPAITAYHPHGSAGPLRDKKGALIRIPGLVRWPGKMKPGTVSAEPISGVDFLPAVCAMTGLMPPQDRPLDGANILPAFDGQPIVRRTPLYWHFNRASSAAKVAVRVGDWKLLTTLDQSPPSRGGEITDESERVFKIAEPATVELYNLRTDIAETTDLAAKEPVKFAELKSALLAKY
jgi:arylsulfatase A